MRRRRDRGVVLLLTMLVLMVLAIVVVQLAFSAQIAHRAAGNLTRDLQNQNALRSGLAVARLFIKADIEGDLTEAPTPPLDHLGEAMMVDLEPFRYNADAKEQTSLYLKIEDEERKFYLPALVDEAGLIVPDQLDRLSHMLEFAAIGDADTADRIAAAMDKEEAGEFDVGVPNRKFYTIKELLSVPGISDEMFHGKTVDEIHTFGLTEILTLYGGGKVNINTAPRPVLYSLSTSVKESDVDGIISTRDAVDSDGNPEVFKNTGFEEVGRGGMTEEVHATIAGAITVRSSFFRARMLARTGSVSRWGSAVIQRVNAVTTLLLWEDDLRFAPDPDDAKAQSEAMVK